MLYTNIGFISLDYPQPSPNITVIYHILFQHILQHHSVFVISADIVAGVERFFGLLGWTEDLKALMGSNEYTE